MADKAYITPKVLKWARESARISHEIAAKSVNVSVDKIIDWENGIEMPTIRQAQNLSKFYKRPFALMFLPDIPEDFVPLRDFRSNANELSTSSIFIIREIQQKQEWISEIYEDNNEDKLDFVGKYSISDNPAIVAYDILNTLNINPFNYVNEPIKDWVNSAEQAGIFVCRSSFIHSKLKLDSNELKGFAIADKYTPFIFINTADYKAPQLFTLVHELAHLWIAESGISNESEFIKHTDVHPIELFCNEVAANALIPESLMLSLDTDILFNSNEFYKVIKGLGVSKYAFLVRALKLEKINIDTYYALKSIVDVEYKQFLQREADVKEKQKEKDGGPSPYLMKLLKNGKLFTQIVLNSLRSGIVHPNQASLLLGTPIDKFKKLEAQMF